MRETIQFTLNGRKVTLELFREVKREELDKVRQAVGDEWYQTGNYEKAAALFDDIIADPDLAEFLTLRAYEELD